VRREVARRALEQLIADGRIHPGRIEEVVTQVREQLEKELVEVGEQTVYELGIRGLHPELIKLVGRMKYRTSYGQNILQHSQEVAWLAGMMAAELKLDVALAKRGALLHDIGKVLTHTHEGTHVQLGVEVATKYGEHPVVVNAIAAHHDDVPHETPISVIVQAADAISGSRPGARREAFETYVKRLTNLETIATSYQGVEKCYAIQAGRELRVVVVPDVVDDAGAQGLSEQIARRIEQELQYPGQIKIVVVRETRAVDFAELIDEQIADAMRAELSPSQALKAGTVPGPRWCSWGEPYEPGLRPHEGQARERLGMHSETIRLAAETREDELLAVIGRPNADPRFTERCSCRPAAYQRDPGAARHPPRQTWTASIRERREGEYRRSDRLPPRQPYGAADAGPRRRETRGAHVVTVGRRTSSGGPWRRSCRTRAWRGRTVSPRRGYRAVTQGTS
jgi:putative nucleotidyltransferase with HDIG domain